jgi:L-threonylcarbamoyladenylate synthase
LSAHGQKVFEAMAKFITRVVAVNPVALDHTIIAEAAAIIRAGQLVAFPTETVYGLGADGLNPTALSRIYAAKGRPPDNPLILHLASQDQLPLVAARVPDIAYTLMQAFWPGPLTLVLPKTSHVPELATGGLLTVAVRMPAHPVALALISASEAPLAAPSANRSGRPSPTTAQHVVADLDGSLPMILDGGPTAIGVESTVLDVTCTPPALLRPGGVPRETIEATIGPLQKSGDMSLQRRSPGTRYRHYSPKAQVLVLEDLSPEALARTVTAALARQQRVGCLLRRLVPTEVPAGMIVVQIKGCVANYARTLFSSLRDLDALGVDVILVEGVPEEGLGVAVMDRLRRAASPPET